MKGEFLSICPYCKFFSHCVLTAKKDRVWECSEYHDQKLDPFPAEPVSQDFKPFPINI